MATDDRHAAAELAASDIDLGAIGQGHDPAVRFSICRHVRDDLVVARSDDGRPFEVEEVVPHVHVMSVGHGRYPPRIAEKMGFGHDREI